MKTQSEKTEVISVVSELDSNEVLAVSGGQAQQGKAYCVYSPNGAVGVNDFSTMTSRPLKPGEMCSR